MAQSLWDDTYVNRSEVEIWLCEHELEKFIELFLSEGLRTISSVKEAFYGYSADDIKGILKEIGVKKVVDILKLTRAILKLFFFYTQMKYNSKDNTITITRYDNKKIDNPIKLNSIHVSCRSDTMQRQDMAGVILYSYDNKTDWRLNHVHCKSGYIILKSWDKIKNIENNQGIVHGKCYKSVFDRDIEADKVVGGGFAFRNGKWKFNSYTFNDKDKRKGFRMEYSETEEKQIKEETKMEDEIHENKNDSLPEKDSAEECERFTKWVKSGKIMHPMEQQCILAAIVNWKKNTQNTVIKDVREEYDGYCKEHECFYYEKNYHTKRANEINTESTVKAFFVDLPNVYTKLDQEGMEMHDLLLCTEHELNELCDEIDLKGMQKIRFKSIIRKIRSSK
eukprot:133670_1